MILAKLENGEMKEIESWATFHPISKITELIVTDGKRIFRTLRGYDAYYAEREALFGAQTGAKGVTKETIFGIADLSKAKEELLAAFNVNLKNVIGSEEKARKCKKRYEDLLRKLNSMEVTTQSLLVEYKRNKREKFNIDDSFVKRMRDKPRSAENFLGRHYSRSLMIR